MECDVLIIGGGIAGLSLAGRLAASASVVLVEAEETLAYHASSRSARQLQPSYGPDPIRVLTRRTIASVQQISAGLGTPILRPRPEVIIGTAAQISALMAGNPVLQPLDHAEALRLSPDLRPESFAAACLDGSALEVDVPALLEFYRSAAVAAGALILTGAPVHTASRTARGWTVGAGGQGIDARTVVNAAGAWADPVAVVFGVSTLGLTPHRRSAALLRTTTPVDPHGVMVAAADDSFYYRPDGEHLLVSPCESVPSTAQDAQVLPGDIEALLHRLAGVTSLGFESVERAWTGLRTSPKDGLPVAGFDAEAPGFFWLAGQGGYGIQTSAALADLAAELVLRGLEPDRAAMPLDAVDRALAAALSPLR
ncbi:NAD(P)/FAD-dependent oxidoreductase [Pseudarthrobacter sp. P1]|uniref:NAD(P)/FAD-dependent oxidoreductase n=1 Tax=Pseudarthrobacter sp. P1 TaxID=3418418 RepID=UPI003CE8470C